MKFGMEFNKQTVPEWIEAYLDYNGLKRVLQEVREFKQSKGPSTPMRTSQQKSSLLRPFSGLDLRKSFDKTKEDDIEYQVIAVETIHKDDNREEYKILPSFVLFAYVCHKRIKDFKIEGEASNRLQKIIGNTT